MKLNQLVEFEHNGVKLIGSIERIVKMSAPCTPSDDPKDWDYHVQVEDDSPRWSGTYCLRLDALREVSE